VLLMRSLRRPRPPLTPQQTATCFKAALLAIGDHVEGGMEHRMRSVDRGDGLWGPVALAAGQHMGGEQLRDLYHNLKGQRAKERNRARGAGQREQLRDERRVAECMAAAQKLVQVQLLEEAALAGFVSDCGEPSVAAVAAAGVLHSWWPAWNALTECVSCCHCALLWSTFLWPGHKVTCWWKRTWKRSQQGPSAACASGTRWPAVHPWAEHCWRGFHRVNGGTQAWLCSARCSSDYKPGAVFMYCTSRLRSQPGPSPAVGIPLIP
jgi:hypothetical protein